MESNSPLDGDRELFSKPQRGRRRLPPLSTAELPGNSECLGNKHQAKDEEKDNGILSENSSGTLRSQNLLTPKVYKHPMSPSNLSIQFTFDEAPMQEMSEPEQLVTSKARDIGPRTSNVHNILQTSSLSLADRTMGNKAYQMLRNDDQRPRTTETGKRVKVGVYKTLSANTDIKSTSSSSRVGKSNNKNVRTIEVSAERLYSGTHALDLKKVGQRKSSIYDLREFLSLPARIERGSISPIYGAKQSRATPVYQKGLAKASPRIAHNTSSDDYMCDVFEFLALSTEAERPSTAKAEKKLNELTAEKTTKAKSATIRKTEIPSVVVADWTIKGDFPRAKRLPRKNRDIPKANFPTNDFPNNSELLTTTSGEEVRRRSTYDIKEFLNLHEVNRKGVTKVTAEDLKMISKPKSKERKPEPREKEAQYDLREFLTFLESRRTSGDGGSAEHGMSLGGPNYRSALSDTESYKNRSLSVYDIYEFLKTTNPLTAPECHHDNGNVNRKASIIDLTADFFAISSPVNDNDRTNHGIGRKTLDKAGKLQGSAYNLREFLRLPAAAHDVSSSEAMKAKAIGKP